MHLLKATPAPRSSLRLARRLASGALLAAAFAAPVFAQQSIFVNFNTNPSADFTFTNGTNAPSYSSAPGTGIGTPAGAFDVFGRNISYAYNTAITTAGVESFTTSMFLRTGGTLSSGTGTAFAHLGFADRTAGANFSGDASAEMFGLRLEGTATTGQVVWRTRVDTVAGSATTSTIGGATAFTIAASTWYLFEATFTKGASAGLWNYSAAVSDYGSTGLALVGTGPLSSVTGSITQAATYGATTLYAAGQYRGGFGLNFNLVDNYSINTTVIPEPSAFAALAGLAGLGLAAGRRRRS